MKTIYSFFLTLLLACFTTCSLAAAPPHGVPVAFYLDNNDFNAGASPFLAIPFEGKGTDASFHNIKQESADTFKLTPGIYEINFWGQFVNSSSVSSYQVGIRFGEQGFISWRTRDGVENDYEGFATTCFFGVFQFDEPTDIQIIVNLISGDDLKLKSRGLVIKKLQ